MSWPWPGLVEGAGSAPAGTRWVQACLQGTVPPCRVWPVLEPSQGCLHQTELSLSPGPEIAAGLTAAWPGAARAAAGNVWPPASSCAPAVRPPPAASPPPPPHCLRHQLPRDWPVWLPSCRPWVSSAAALGGGSASAYLPALLAVGAGPPGSALTRARVAGRQCDGEVARQGTPCAGGGFLVMAPAVPSTVQAVLRLSWGPDPPPHPCSTVAGAPLARTAPVRGSHAICVGLGLCTISWG